MSNPVLDATKGEVYKEVLAKTVIGFFEEFLKPRLAHEAHFDLRRDLVERIHEFFEQSDLIACVPDAVHQVLEELKRFPLHPPCKT